jgi:hypothetical protein
MSDVAWVGQLPGAGAADPAVSVQLPGVDVGTWEISAKARRSLTQVGLPRNDHAGLLPESRPMRSPVTIGQVSGYRIARFRRLHLLVVPSAGRVVGAAFDEPDEFFVNSSVELFVEAAWRHYQLIGEMERRGVGEDDIFDALDLFLESINDLDPAVGSDPALSFWPDVVESW